jgi:hypothetical protein
MSDRKYFFFLIVSILISAFAGWVAGASFGGAAVSAGACCILSLILFSRSHNELMNKVQQDLEREFEEMEEADVGTVGLREKLITHATNENVDKIWQAEISRLNQSGIFEENLLAEYRRVALRLYDEVSPFYSEKVAEYKTSMILRMLGKTPYSFRRFCKALGF